jgi:hypothetical protein
MKKIGQYTARGIVSEADTAAGKPQLISLFDGRFDTGYRVVEFYIWGSTYSGSAEPDVIGKLSKNDDGVGASGASFMRADDNNQIAWATSAGTTDAGGAPFAETIIDPDNMIIEDLYVYARGSSSTTTQAINYLVVLEKYDITDWQGALTMARDRAQGDL